MRGVLGGVATSSACLRFEGGLHVGCVWRKGVPRRVRRLGCRLCSGTLLGRKAGTLWVGSFPLGTTTAGLLCLMFVSSCHSCLISFVLWCWRWWNNLVFGVFHVRHFRLGYFPLHNPLQDCLEMGAPSGLIADAVAMLVGSLGMLKAAWMSWYGVGRRCMSFIRIRQTACITD